MDNKMLIDAEYDNEVRVAVVNGDKKLEYLEIESKNRNNLKGNIYVAKVVRIEPSLQAVFVDYGHDKQGFLGFSDIHPSFYQKKVAENQKKTKGITTGTNNDSNSVDDFAELERALEEINEELRKESSIDNSATDVTEDKIDTSVSTFTTPPVQNTEVHATTSSLKIQDVINLKQLLLVQVTKEERGNKCAAMTTYISLVGRYCIFMPNSTNQHAISKKIVNPSTRNRLKKILDEINPNEDRNIVVRTSGERKSKQDITKDFDFLLQTWDEVMLNYKKATIPTLVYKESCLIKRSLRDMYSKDVSEVIVFGEEAYKLSRTYMSTLMPSHVRRIKQYKEAKPLFLEYGVYDQVDSAYSSTVRLPSGGYITINPTEALISIDVNSGKSTRESNLEETALFTNLEAIKEIFRQLVIRNMSGLIIIDFIDMESEENNLTVEKALKGIFKNDKAKVLISKMSKFGLIEISRQRIKPSIVETFFDCCPMCEGFGFVNHSDFAALRIIRSINKYLLEKNGSVKALKVVMHSTVMLCVVNDYKEELIRMEEKYATSVELSVDDNISLNAFKVELIDSNGDLSVKQQQQPIHNKNNNIDRQRKTIPIQINGEESMDNNNNVKEKSTRRSDDYSKDDKNGNAVKKDFRRSSSKKDNSDNNNNGKTFSFVEIEKNNSPIIEQIKTTITGKTETVEQKAEQADKVKNKPQENRASNHVKNKPFNRRRKFTKNSKPPLPKSDNNQDITTSEVKEEGMYESVKTQTTLQSNSENKKGWWSRFIK